MLFQPIHQTHMVTEVEFSNVNMKQVRFQAKS